MQKLRTGAARSRVAAHRLITGAVAALIAAVVAVGGAIPLTAPAMAANVRVTTNGDNAANTTGDNTNATGENTENSENAERAAEAASARLEVAVAEPADQKANGVKSGALASYDVQWSCAGVQGQCENTTLSVTIPGLVDSISSADQLPLTHVSATNSSHDQSAVPVREGDTYTWNLGTVPVGTTGAMRVQVRPENLRWPEGEAIHPKVAGETNGLVADPVELTTPVHATPPSRSVNSLPNPSRPSVASTPTPLPPVTKAPSIPTKTNSRTRAPALPASWASPKSAWSIPCSKVQNSYAPPMTAPTTRPPAPSPGWFPAHPSYAPSKITASR
ncbi:hypothetical protein [Actinotignum schaalii]